MKKSKTTKRALLSSCIALMLCFSMLLGTTYAWFTDEVISSNNIIKSGTLEAEMLWCDTNSTNEADWKDASAGAIFDYRYWEPGYAQVKYVEIKNVGSLAFKYQLNIVPEFAVATGDYNLADVIDVYFGDPTKEGFEAPSKTNRTGNLTKVGTLSSLMADPDGAAYGYMLPAEGMNEGAITTLLPEHAAIATTGSATYCIVLKMQEEAGNEYQNLSVGEGFKVQLLATQYTYEEDSFDNMYDEGAGYDALPNATVSRVNAEGVSTYLIKDIINESIGSGTMVKLNLDTAYSFKGEPVESAEKSPYADWFVDFYVSLDKAPADGLVLSGQYGSWDEDNWYAFYVPTDFVEAGEFYPLLGTVTGGGVSNWEYTEICSGVGTFNCGAVDMNGLNEGTTMTVELRVINPDNTDETITVKSVEYTFGKNAYTVMNGEELASVLTGTDESINVVLATDIDLPITSLGEQTPGSGEYKLGGEDTQDITIDLNGNKLNITTGYWSAIGAKNNDATITIKNGSMTSSQATGTWNSYDLTFANCNYVIEDVVFEKAIALCNEGKTATLKNVTINETHDYYALWITAEGQTVEIDGLTIESAGRGIKIDEQYVATPAKVTLKVSDAEFNTAKKAAIMVKSAAGADIEVKNIDISGVAADTVNAVWVDADAAAYADLVAVTGASVIVEQ